MAFAGMACLAGSPQTTADSGSQSQSLGSKAVRAHEVYLS